MSVFSSLSILEGKKEKKTTTTKKPHFILKLKGVLIERLWERAVIVGVSLNPSGWERGWGWPSFLGMQGKVGVGLPRGRHATQSPCSRCWKLRLEPLMAREVILGTGGFC